MSATDWLSADAFLARRAFSDLGDTVRAISDPQVSYSRFRGAFERVTADGTSARFDPGGNPQSEPLCWLEYVNSEMPQEPEGTFGQNADPLRRWNLLLFTWVEAGAPAIVGQKIAETALAALQTNNGSEASHFAQVRRTRPGRTQRNGSFNVLSHTVPVFGGATG